MLCFCYSSILCFVFATVQSDSFTESIDSLIELEKAAHIILEAFGLGIFRATGATYQKRLPDTVGMYHLGTAMVAKQVTTLPSLQCNRSDPPCFSLFYTWKGQRKYRDPIPYDFP